jgi:hypothetical protein
MTVLPFLMYDLLYIQKELFKHSALFEFINTLSSTLDEFIVFLIIYVLLQVLFFKFLLQKIYNKSIVSGFDD